jgi:hypothetical protein
VEVDVRRWDLLPLGKAPPTAVRWTDGKRLAKEPPEADMPGFRGAQPKP